MSATLAREVPPVSEFAMQSAAPRRGARILCEALIRQGVDTIFGLIGTIASGLLGMNIIAEAERPAGVRLLIFLIFLGSTVALTVVTVAQSKRLADILDVMSDARLTWSSKWKAMRAAWRSPA